MLGRLARTNTNMLVLGRLACNVPRRRFSVLALGNAPRAGPALAATPTALASPAALPSPSWWAGGLLGACRCVSMRLRSSKQRPKAARPKKPKTPRFKWNIFRGDQVGVNRGPERGKVGEVLSCRWKEAQVVVSGVNLVKMKVLDESDPDDRQRVWVEKEMPIPYSRVNLIDPVDKGRTRIHLRYLPSGQKVRIGVRSGAVIPKPQPEVKERPTIDPSPFCTEHDDAHEVTFVPFTLKYRAGISLAGRARTTEKGGAAAAETSA